MHILIIIPQHNEFEYLLEGFASEGEGYGLKNLHFGSIRGAKLNETDCIIATGGHGKAQFAAQTQYLISYLPNVELVICAGASGSLVHHILPGDIVVATSTIEHDYKLRFTEEPQPVHSGDPDMLEQLQIISQKYSFPFDIHFGTIASGNEDIIEKKCAKVLHTKTNALCVAWEGSGGVRAAALNKLPFLEIRVVTDTADGTAPNDF